MSDVEVQKRIKALNKKLSQIVKLKEKSQHTQEEADKVASEASILKEIKLLEKGESLEQAASKAGGKPKKDDEAKSPAAKAPQDSAAAPPEAEIPQSPSEEKQEEQQEEPEAPEEPEAAIDAAEAEKRIKGLKKKLAQISKLKEKDSLTAEENEKVGKEPEFLAEIQQLEFGMLEPEAKKNAISIQKKLDQIKKLKGKAGLSAQEREKVSKGPALMKELEEIMSKCKA